MVSIASNESSTSNASTEDSDVWHEYPLAVIIAYVCFYVAMFVLAFLGNTMALLTCYKKYNSSYSILLCHIASLAVADLFFSVLTIFDIVYFFLGDWPGGNAFCKIQGFLIETSYTASILTLIAISYERARSVSSNKLARKRGVEHRTVIVKLVWVATVVLCLPLFYGYATVEGKGKQLCRNKNWGDRGRQAYYMLQAVLIFICPLLFMIWAHSKILRALSKHTRNNSVSSVESKQHKVTKMLAVVTLVFFFCWSPFIVVRALRYFYVYRGVLVWRLTQLIIFANSAINPILYCFYSRQFRRSFKEIIRCRFQLRGRKRNRTRSQFSTFALQHNVNNIPAMERVQDSTNTSSQLAFQ